MREDAADEEEEWEESAEKCTSTSKTNQMKCAEIHRGL